MFLSKIQKQIKTKQVRFKRKSGKFRGQMLLDRGHNK